jgi:16S rRNA (guanine527-N7)-methyltransferase
MKTYKDQFSAVESEKSLLQRMGVLFQRSGIQLSEGQLQQIWSYHQFIRQYNPELNLTRIHNFENMVIKLYVDSILPAKLLPLPIPLLDLGTGAGMPGIPLKIWQPQLEILLAESRRNRLDFLGKAVEHISLQGIRIIDKKIDSNFQQPVAGVITRAVEEMSKTLTRVRGCLAPLGKVIFMKGPSCDAEIEKIQRSSRLKFRLILNQSYRIPHTKHRRRLVVFERMDKPLFERKARAMKQFSVKVIESDQNSRYKKLKKILTSRGIKKTGQALMAGSKTIKETMTRFPQCCEAWISAGDGYPPPLEAPKHIRWFQLAPGLFHTLDIFGTHDPLLLLRYPEIHLWRPTDGFKAGCNLLIPFQDPENVGAVIRSAAAFDVKLVIMLAESAHPFHPKALRVSGGAVLSVQLLKGPSIDDIPRELPIIALSAEGENIRSAVFPGRFGLLIGLEGQGLPSVMRKRAWRIPIGRGVESLNAAAAAAVALYQWSCRSLSND